MFLSVRPFVNQHFSSLVWFELSIQFVNDQFKSIRYIDMPIAALAAFSLLGVTFAHPLISEKNNYYI